jgi:hypothetical protein
MVRIRLLFRVPRLFPPQRVLFTEVRVTDLSGLVYTRLGGNVDLDERFEEFSRVVCL